MPPVATAVLECRALGVRFADPEVEALRALDLEERPGEMVAILGATGAGKSTLLKSVNRVIPELQHARVTGDIRLFGEPIEGRRVSELAGRVGFVFQDFEAQLFSTSVFEELLFGLEQRGVDSGQMGPRIREALDQVGLGGFERRDPTSLSGGEKQRLAIAAVLALRPGLLILDEPSTDLDPAGRREIFALLASLRATGAALLVAEHDTESIREADQVVVLHQGAVALRGAPRDVFRSPRALAAIGARPPELALVCSALDLDPWPLDVDSVEARIRGADIRWESPSPVTGGAAAAPILLEARDLTFRYPHAKRDALRDVSFRLHAGEFVALIGSNGSGKSTLARHLNGLLRTDHGTVLWRGRPVSALDSKERARAVGYVFQNPDEQIFAATVEEEVGFGPRQLGHAAAEVRRRVEEALAAVGLEGLTDRDPFLLGKGERQKVAVASILALSPSVLILDEPTTGLDDREARSLLEALGRLNRLGQAIVVITHVSWVVASYARRAVLMSAGRVIHDGSVRDLLADEATCRRGDFVPGESTRLGRRFGVTPLTVEECVSWMRRV